MTFGDCSPLEHSPAPAPSIEVSTSTTATATTGRGFKKSFANSDGQRLLFGWLTETGLIIFSFIISRSVTM